MAKAVGTLKEKNHSAEIQVNWEIPNFLSLDNDYWQPASNFRFLNNSWNLKIDTFAFEDPNNIGLYLEIGDPILPCNIMITFGIRKANGSLVGVKSFEFTFSDKNKSFKANDFFTRSDLEKLASELMPSNILTIVCTLKYLSGSDKLRGQDLLSENIKSFFNNKELCDVTLQLQDKEFQAHRFILAARSPVFAAMFRHETSEKKTGVINIEDCDPESFQIFLDYIYSGKLDDIPLCNAPHLYKAAHKYDLDELKMFCVEYILNNLKKENFFQVIILAEEYEDAKLFNGVQYFFNRNLKEIFASDDWGDFSREHVTLTRKLLLEMASKVKAIE